MTRKCIIKAGNYYVADSVDYSNYLGYLGRKHPKRTIKLTKFEMKAKVFGSVKEALKFTKNIKFEYELLYLLDDEKVVEKAKYLASNEIFNDCFSKMAHERGKDVVKNMLNITENTYDKLINGNIDYVPINNVLRIIKLMIALGYKELRTYLERCKAISERRAWNDLETAKLFTSTVRPSLRPLA